MVWRKVISGLDPVSAVTRSWEPLAVDHLAGADERRID